MLTQVQHDEVAVMQVFGAEIQPSFVVFSFLQEIV